MTHDHPSAARPLRIGTRGSPLAMWQAREVRRTLMAAHRLSEETFAVVPIRVTGDSVQDKSLREIGGKGLFTREIEEALAEGVIDIAVHSMKDMPADQPAGLVLDCFLPRADVRDAFVSLRHASLADLPAGGIVGTSSLRRRAQLLWRRPDLRVVEFRGNVGTRLRKLEEGVAEATFLAMAGLLRLGKQEVARAPIAPEDMLPAVAQGAIGVERRANDAAVAVLLAPVHDHATGLRLAAERAFLRRLDGSCRTPIAGLAMLEGDRLWLRGEILRPDGSEAVADEIRGPADQGAALGAQLAEGLLARAGPGFLDPG